LENLQRIGKLKAHDADEREIARLVESAERGLRDAAAAELSANSRLDLAYGAIMQAALAAMFASGYRPSTSEPGHHQLLIQALPITLGLPHARARVLDAYRKARNQSDYRGMPVSDALAQECIAHGRELLAAVREKLGV
jgi:hypothetical protein